MKPQARGKILQIFLSSTPNRKVGLQIRVIKEVEDLQCFSYVTTEVEHYEEEASRQNDVQARI